MLIYNYQKEFLGIDEADLKALGFNNLLELRSESADFADLFVKTPGFVHNFKHVHWIDFIDCAESSEDAKVIIHAKAKNFRCTIKINTIYLIDNPSQKAYSVNLNNLRLLSAQENEQIAQDILLKPTPKATTVKTAIFENQNLDDYAQESIENKVVPVNVITPDPYEENHDTTLKLDSYDVAEPFVENDFGTEALDEKLSIDDYKEETLEKMPQTTDSFVEEDSFKLDLDMDDLEFEEETKQEVKKSTVDESVDFDNSYVYDPKVASSELGLPVDLIEEFIEDFIAQAKEFKTGLYDSLNDGDINNVKVLSHKLKGVAANLRVEDAFEVLTTVNVSNDFNEIKINLDHFYKIIAKLSGESIPEPQAKAVVTPTVEDDDLDIGFKDEITIDENSDNEDDDEFMIKMSDLDEIEEPEEKIVQVEDEEEDEEDDLYMDNTLEINSKEDITSKDPIDIDLNLDEENLELLNLDEPTIQESIEENDSLLTESVTDSNYDKKSIANEIGLNRENFDVLFADFLDESKSLTALINSAIEQGDSQVWKKGAIKLKGMSDNMRIHAFSADLDALIDTDDTTIAKETMNKVSSTLTKISNI